MTIHSRFSLAGLVLAAACGGGGAATGASLAGTIYEVDGQSIDRSGVRVGVMETGDLATTGQDGAFTFGGLPPGAVTLLFAAPGSPTADSEEIDIPPGRGVRVLVAIENGVVVHMCVSDDEKEHAKAPLEAAPDSPLPEVDGEIEVESEPGEEEFEIEATNLEPGTEVDFLLDDPGDALGFVGIGTVAADEDGKAKLKLRTEDGDPLPLGVASVADLAGFAVEVRLTATGELLLTGEVPAVDVPGFDDDDDDDEAEEEDDDEEEEEEEEDDD